ncbi:TPA: prenyltransferase [Candidatus Micrarchaeota archaeon]|nr:prenyltransferase [Candidatus Micrarchaeota archaeon]
MDKQLLTKALTQTINLPPLMVVVPATIAGLIVSGPFDAVRFLLVILLTVITDTSANVINNYSDWEIDKMNNKRKEMHETFSKKSLIATYALLLAGVAALLFVLGANLFLIASTAAFAFLGLVYSWGPKLKDVTPLNYISIALAYGGLSFCMGLFSQNGSAELLLTWLPVILAIVMIDIGYSITKDYVDYEGDKHYGKKTLPVILGKQKAIFVQFGVILAAYTLLAIALYVEWISLAYAWFFLSFAIAVYMLRKVNYATERSELKQAYFITAYNGLFVRAILIAVLLFGV